MKAGELNTAAQEAAAATEEKETAVGGCGTGEGGWERWQTLVLVVVAAW